MERDVVEDQSALFLMLGIAKKLNEIKNEKMKSDFKLLGSP